MLWALGQIFKFFHANIFLNLFVQKLPCQDSPNRNTLYDVGCVNVTSTFVREHSAVVGGAAVAVAAIMVQYIFVLERIDELRITLTII